MSGMSGVVERSSERFKAVQREQPMALQLLVLKDGRRVPLRAQPVSIGSASFCQIAFKNSELKPCHATVSLSGRKAILEQADQDCEIKVNGKSITRWALVPGDLIQVGADEIRYQEEPIAGAPAEEGKAQALAMPQSRRPVKGDTVLIGGSSSSSRRLAVTDKKTSESMRLLQREAFKPSHSAAEQVKADFQRAGRALRWVLAVALLLAVIVPVIVALPHLKAWRESRAAEAVLRAKEAAAFERLASGAPKTSEDLAFAVPKLKACRSWEDVEAMLGKPDATFEGAINLLESAVGLVTLQGKSFRVYQLKVEDTQTPPDVLAHAQGTVLLFEVMQDGAFLYHEQRLLARDQTTRVSTPGSEPAP